MKEKIADNLKHVTDNIAEACARSNRDPRDVRLIAVTKTVDIDVIETLLSLGQADLGESRVQQLVERHTALQDSNIHPANGEVAATAPIQPHWHMVGHLQRNKVKQLLPVVDYIHSVDSLRLAEEINTAAARLGLAEKVKIFLQVNTSKEKQKFGLAVGAVDALAEQVQTLPNLRIVGLMTMAPLTADSGVCRFNFARLREIFDDMYHQKICGPHFKHLSMGMSQDYVAAVEEGATMVRIGTALFE